MFGFGRRRSLEVTIEVSPRYSGVAAEIMISGEALDIYPMPAWTSEERERVFGSRHEQALREAGQGVLFDERPPLERRMAGMLLKHYGE